MLNINYVISVTGRSSHNQAARSTAVKYFLGNRPERRIRPATGRNRRPFLRRHSNDNHKRHVTGEKRTDRLFGGDEMVAQTEIRHQQQRGQREHQMSQRNYTGDEKTNYGP